MSQDPGTWERVGQSMTYDSTDNDEPAVYIDGYDYRGTVIRMAVGLDMIPHGIPYDCDTDDVSEEWEETGI